MNVEGKDCGLDPHEFRALSFVDRWLLGRLAAGEARHRREPRHLSLRPRGAGALRVRVGRVLRLVRRVREGPAAAGRGGRRRRRGARHALGARARARGHAAARASVHAVHHRGAVADGRAARRQVGRDDLAAAVSQGELRQRRSRPRSATWRTAARSWSAPAARCAARWGCRPRSACRCWSPAIRTLLAHFAPYLTDARQGLRRWTSSTSCPATDAPVQVVGETRLMLHIEIDRRRGARAPREGNRAPRRRRSRKATAKLAQRELRRARARARSSSRSARGSRACSATLEQLKAQLARLSELTRRHDLVAAPTGIALGHRAMSFALPTRSARCGTGTSGCSSSGRGSR